MIAEGTLLGPKQAQAAAAAEAKRAENVEYEPFEFEDGLCVCVRACVHVFVTVVCANTYPLCVCKASPSLPSTPL